MSVFILYVAQVQKRDDLVRLACWHKERPKQTAEQQADSYKRATRKPCSGKPQNTPLNKFASEIHLCKHIDRNLNKSNANDMEMHTHFAK